MKQIRLTSGQLSSVNEYCKLNNIDDVDKFITKCYTEGFNITKYGIISDDSEKPKEIEVIREIRVEIPVEKIVYIYDKKEEEVVPNLDNICDKPEPIIVEKIVEVIKEVPVEKNVEVEKPNDKVLLLQQTLQKLRKELSVKNTRIEDLEKINKQLESGKVNRDDISEKGPNITEII